MVLCPQKNKANFLTRCVVYGNINLKELHSMHNLGIGRNLFLVRKFYLQGGYTGDEKLQQLQIDLVLCLVHEVGEEQLDRFSY